MGCFVVPIKHVPFSSLFYSIFSCSLISDFSATILGVFTSEMEVTTAIPPAQMFKAFVLDNDKVIPKIASEAIQNVELIEGDGGPGSIKKITFGEGSQVKYVKHKIEAIDEKGFSFNYSLIEGNALMNNLEKISYDIKFMGAPDADQHQQPLYNW
ncbi:hypothetical protein SLE2022_164240 [Rubroshorea leprosula]